MSQMLAIAAGGALGSVLRYAMSTWIYTLTGRGFPYGTLVVNVLGCLAMGALFVLLVERMGESTLWRAGLLIGLLGGFTTFSTFSIETFNLIEQGAMVKAAGNMTVSLFLCVGATWLGVLLARHIS